MYKLLLIALFSTVYSYGSSNEQLSRWADIVEDETPASPISSSNAMQISDSTLSLEELSSDLNNSLEHIEIAVNKKKFIRAAKKLHAKHIEQDYYNSHPGWKCCIDHIKSNGWFWVRYTPPRKPIACASAQTNNEKAE